MQTMTRENWTDERLDDLNGRVRVVDDRVAGGFHRMDQEFTAVRREISTQGKELREEMVAQGKELREEMAAQTKELREEMAAQTKELREEMAAQTKELRGEIKTLATEMNARFDLVHARLDSLGYKLLYLCVGYAGIVVTAVIAMAAING